MSLFCMHRALGILWRSGVGWGRMERLNDGQAIGLDDGRPDKEKGRGRGVGLFDRLSPDKYHVHSVHSHAYQAYQAGIEAI